MSTLSPMSARKPSAPFSSAGPSGGVSVSRSASTASTFFNANNTGTNNVSGASAPGSPVVAAANTSDPVWQLMQCHSKELAAIRQAHNEEMTLLREQNSAIQEGLDRVVRQLQSQAELDVLKRRYASILTVAPGTFTTDLVAFWKGLGGLAKWKTNITPAELTALLATDTREEVAFKDTSLPAGFFEVILARLPCLKRCSLNGTRYFFNLADMTSVKKPFSQLVHLELQNTNCTDYDVTELGQRLTSLRTFYVNGCVRVTWEGLEQARRASSPGLTLLPSNTNAKELQDNTALEKLWLDYTSAESASEYRRLSALYSQYLEGGSDPTGLVGLWTHKEELKPVQLTLLLSRQTRTTYAITCPPQDAGTMEEQVLRAEMRRFCTYILPRLPKLQRVDIHDAPEFPFNFAAMPQKGLFPCLTHISMRNTPCTVSQLRELLKRVPTLKPSGTSDTNAVEVDLAAIENDSVNPTLVGGLLDNKVLAYALDRNGHPTVKKTI